MTNRKKIVEILAGTVLTLFCFRAAAQTDNDAIMMNKNQWCNGAVYMHGQWNNYWEGTNKRNNANIGTVSTQSIIAMSNFGITDNLNVMVSAPYIWTNASAGTLHGFKGFQDGSLFVKWKPFTTALGGGKFSIFTIAGISSPLSKYSIDLLPVSIGVGSTNFTARLMAYYKSGIFFARASGAYVWRSNTYLDRTAYYTTSIHNTNEVAMPDMANFNGSIGIYKKYLIAEIMVDNMVTLGGFDIRKNDMPFPSNKMNATSLGAHVKYTLPFDTHISVLGGGDYVVAGRNVGQSTTFNVGAFYAFYTSKHATGFREHSSKN